MATHDHNSMPLSYRFLEYVNRDLKPAGVITAAEKGVARFLLHLG